jgi:acyl carrier protein
MGAAAHLSRSEQVSGEAVTTAVHRFERAAVSEWIIGYIADLLQIDKDAVDLATDLAHYGLDSADAVIMGAAMEEYFDVELDPGMFIEFPTFQAMIDSLDQGSPTDKT